ncbi:MAG: hypothetical protein H0V88_14925 [Pyrinomonadaceae bacterium]|nr:hypothetical protein [Pyrinomonadaceae bacterium]
MTTCPCCGSSFKGTLEEGCASCGAHAVGPALPQPPQKLPAYEQAFLVATMSALLASAFLASFVVALAERGVFPLSLDDFVTTLENAAWRLKYTVLPLSVIGLWASWSVTKRMRRAPARFTGHGIAHACLALTGAIMVTNAVGIGISIPERLRVAQIAHEAANNALLYASHRAILDYQACYGTYPATLDDLRKLPDADGSIAAALDHLASSEYRPTAPPTAQLTNSNSSGRSLRGSTAKLRYAKRRVNADDGVGAGVSFNNYELKWPGEDKIFGTADDRVMRDGVFVESSQYPNPRPTATASASPRTPR